MKNYPEIVKGISANLKVLRSDIGDTMQGFSALAQAATKSQALDKKTKELIALSIGVATRCDGCIGFHSEALVKLGATREEVGKLLAWLSIWVVALRLCTQQMRSGLTTSSKLGPTPSQFKNAHYCRPDIAYGWVGHPARRISLRQPLADRLQFLPVLCARFGVAHLEPIKRIKDNLRYD